MWKLSSCYSDTLDHVRPYLQVSQKRLEEMFTNVL